MALQKLLVIDVSHGTIHDGPGMRTTVFVKGCPLRCRWCQNPESKSRNNSVWWDGTLCIGCGLCRQACAKGVICFGEGGVAFDRSACEDCGACARACPTSAMARQGQEYTMEELLWEVLRDRHYYRQFGGGVTVSGGEPLLQHEFVTEFFRQLKEEGITTALDTCGCAPWYALKSVLGYTDYVLYDIKILDGEQHLVNTGADNSVILENLLRTAEMIRNTERKMHLWIRTPLIPGATATAENIEAIAGFIREHLMDVTERWELCAFNGACEGKYKKLGESWEYAGVPLMAVQEAKGFRECAISMGIPASILSITGLLK